MSSRFEQVFFQSTPCLSAHLSALRTDPDKYTKELQYLLDNGTFSVVSSGVRARILAALHIFSQHDAVARLLNGCEATDIVKALNLLDRPRTVRQLRLKVQKIQDQDPHVLQDFRDEQKPSDTEKRKQKRKRHRKYDIHRRRLRLAEAELQNHGCDETSCADAHTDSAVIELIQSASVSGALGKKIQKWAKINLTTDFLEYVLLALPTEPWRDLANLVHFRPDDFQLSFFLSAVHNDKAIPEESFVARMKRLTESSDIQVEQLFFDLACEFPQTHLHYSFIRTQQVIMSRPKIVEHLAQHMPLDTVIWYFEELFSCSRRCKDIVSARLRDSENNSRSVRSKVTYGKLMERILTFRRMRLKFAGDIVPLASRRLEELRAQWAENIDAKVAVFGDASSSMQPAIEAATIFASMVSACFDGELSFFSSQLVESPHGKPSNVNQTLDVCGKIRARGCTCLAAALWPYYEGKKWVDTFILVTDEYENTASHGFLFAQLLAKYRATVNKHASLVVVCVGKGHKVFRQSLDEHGIAYHAVLIDESRPDLAKFDALLGQLAMISSNIPDNSSTDEGGTEKGDDFVLV